mmetsp:Transcript_117181/g.250400  ORF Transcript_117181/g.250400 Transcript_117181/m.250400 type:complete len:282 (+) Transcript_117181:601-1446(+)
MLFVVLEKSKQLLVLAWNVKPDTPVKLPQANGTQVEVIRLVLHRLSVAAAHQAIEPSAVLQPEHVADLMQHGLDGAVEQLHAPGLCEAALRHVPHEAEDSHPLGEAREAVDEVPLRLREEVAHGDAQEAVAIAGKFGAYGVEHIRRIPLLPIVVVATRRPRLQICHRHSGQGLHGERREEGRHGCFQNLPRGPRPIWEGRTGELLLTAQWQEVDGAAIFSRSIRARIHEVPEALIGRLIQHGFEPLMPLRWLDVLPFAPRGIQTASQSLRLLRFQPFGVEI